MKGRERYFSTNKMQIEFCLLKFIAPDELCFTDYLLLQFADVGYRLKLYCFTFKKAFEGDELGA